MGINQYSSVFISHSGLELIKPNARVNCHPFALHVFQPIIRTVLNFMDKLSIERHTGLAARWAVAKSIVPIHPSGAYVGRSRDCVVRQSIQISRSREGFV